MAIPNDYIDKITNKDSGESRIISPAAGNVRVDNENFEGTDLDKVLDEVAQAIDEAGSGDGTVTGVKVGSTTYEPTDGVVDLSTPFGGKVDKNGTDSLMTAAEHTKLQNLPTNEQLIQQFGSKANDADVVKSISVNGQAQQKNNGNVNIVVPSGGLTESDISVETQGDGTVDINVGSDTYTINLNHTHEGMTKLVKCTEATLPQTMADDTIYVQVDNLTTPTEIEKLYLFGLKFSGGGVPDTGEPMISSPSNGTTINLGENSGSGVSKTITVKGKNLTGDLTVAVGTGLTISYGQALDASRVTIPMAQALLGAQVTIAYSGTGALDDGSLVISQGNDVLSSVVVVVVVVAPVALTAIKLTGTQWLQTDYYPNAATEFEMELKLTANSYTNSLQSVGNGIFLLRASNDTGSNRWDLNNGNGNNASLWRLIMHLDGNIVGTEKVTENNHALFTADHTIIKLVKTSSTQATFYFAGQTIGVLNLKVGTTSLPLAIGYNYQAENNGPIYKAFDLTIYRLTITENGSPVRNYVPVTLDGVPGLYDEIHDEFISSKTESDVVAVE